MDHHPITAWMLPIGDWPEDAGLHHLSGDEVERWGRFLFPADRRLYAAAHALMRVSLSALVPGMPPQGWQFSRGQWGRPDFAEGEWQRAGGNGQAPSFNLTHCRGMAAFAIGWRGPVGIDAEPQDRTIRVDELAPAVLSADELAALTALPDLAARHNRLLGHWTLKEAYIKAVGRGLSLPVDSFTVWPEPPTILPPPDDHRRWLAANHKTESGHRLSVAAPALAGEEEELLVSWRIADPDLILSPLPTVKS